MSSVWVARDIFYNRKVRADHLPPARPKRLPLDEARQARRSAAVEKQVGSAVAGIVHRTTALLFRDLCLGPGLAPRDRSLVTGSALIASSQVAQMPFHLNFYVPSTSKPLSVLNLYHAV